MVTQTSRAYLEERLDGIECGLGIGRIKDGLNQQDVHPAIQQGSSLVHVGASQLIKGDVPAQQQAVFKKTEYQQGARAWSM